MNKLFTGLALLFTTIAFAKGSYEFKLIHTADLVSMMKQKTTEVAIYDANTDDTRKKDGIIPGAKLLPSSKDYDVTKDITQNKNANLVFYCANQQCTASHTAAKKAMSAGYPNVYVMADGIQGWKKSGQVTTKP